MGGQDNMLAGVAALAGVTVRVTAAFWRSPRCSHDGQNDPP
jgi:hypothetical protein